MQSFHATALYDYEPANDDELEIYEGDGILVTMRRDDGWFQGTNLETNLSGLFPGNYVKNTVWLRMIRLTMSLLLFLQLLTETETKTET